MPPIEPLTFRFDRRHPRNPRRFWNKEQTMDDPGAELRLEIQDVLPHLRRMTDGDASHHPAPDKWSPKEVIGHLIDSATNNHGRFVRATLQEEMVFPGYDQDGWVKAQEYANHSWEDLVGLW